MICHLCLPCKPSCFAHQPCVSWRDLRCALRFVGLHSFPCGVVCAKSQSLEMRCTSTPRRARALARRCKLGLQTSSMPLSVNTRRRKSTALQETSSILPPSSDLLQWVAFCSAFGKPTVRGESDECVAFARALNLVVFSGHSSVSGEDYVFNRKTYSSSDLITLPVAPLMESASSCGCGCGTEIPVSAVGDDGAPPTCYFYRSPRALLTPFAVMPTCSSQLPYFWLAKCGTQCM